MTRANVIKQFARAMHFGLRVPVETQPCISGFLVHPVVHAGRFVLKFSGNQMLRRRAAGLRHGGRHIRFVDFVVAPPQPSFPTYWF